MITIKDMAEAAGVSPTTVANVLHSRTHKMSKETLKKVQDVIDSSNYVSNMGARLLANYGSRIIGVIMNYDRRSENNVIADPFYGTIVGSLEKEIRENGYYMMLYTTGEVDEMIKLASSWNIEGLIALGCNSSDIEMMKEKLHIPVVYIDSYYNNRKNISFHNIGLDDFGGGYMMTNYLIHQGHKKIAFLADEVNPQGVDLMRLNGYKKALEENDIEFKSDDYVPISFRKRSRHNILWKFCAERIKDYTALFFASDLYACDAIHQFQAQGIRVPEDISVVGFDDNYFSSYCYPMITTVHQEISDKGYEAFKLLHSLIKGDDRDFVDNHLPVKLVIRESVKSL